MNRLRRASLKIGLSAALIAASAGGVFAADLIRVGKASPGSFSFVPLDVGKAAGIFKKHGINLQIIGFSGGSKMQQALAADSIDVAFGSGPEMILTQKGAPMKAIAEMAGAPLIFAIITPYDSPIKTLDELKGKKIGVSGNPSLSSFMAKELAIKKGWGANGITPVVVGGMASGVVAALRTHQVDAVTFDLREGLQLQALKQGRVLAPCSDYVTHFITHVIFAQNAIMKKNPAALKRFLAAWFDTIKYMKSHKAISVKIASKITGAPESLESMEYDHIVPHFFSPNGHFVKRDLAAVADALVQLHSVSKPPDMSKLYTTAFLAK